MTDCEDNVWLGSEARSAVPGWDIDAYDEKALGLSPLAYYPMDDKSGAVIEDISGNDYDADLDGASWLYQQGGIGDGKGSMSSQGLAAHDIDAPAALNLIFQVTPPGLNEGSYAAWLYAEAADYSPAADSYLFTLDESGPEVLYARLDAGGSVFRFFRDSSPPALAVTFDNGAEVGWFHFGATWSLSNDRMRLFYNGVQQGADVTGLVSSGAVNLKTFGRGVLATWPGRMAKAAFWASEIAPADYVTLATL